MKVISLALFCLVSPGLRAAREKPPRTYTIPVPPKPDYSSLDWLMGEWSGQTDGQSPAGEIQLTTAYALDKRFVILHEEISFQATKIAPARSESWMGILSARTGRVGFLLTVFSSTGFATRYSATVDGNDIRFSPEGGEETPPGWLFRRLIRRSSDAQLQETVEAAPPEKAFFVYYTATLNHKPAQPAKSEAPSK